MTPLLAITMLGLVASDVTHRISMEPKTVEQLYAMYNRYDLWLPPKGTQLIRWQAKERRTIRDQPFIHLDLMIRAKTKTVPALVQSPSGVFEWTEHRDSRLKVVEPTIAAIEGGLEFSTDDWLDLTIVAHHLGWMDIAKESFRRANIKPSPGYFGMVKVRGDATCQMQTFLRNHAWSHYYHSLLDVKTDRTHSFKMMKLILEDDSRFRTNFNLELVANLKKTLEQKNRGTGIEKWIDELCDAKLSLYDPDGWNVQPTAYNRLCLAGFDAVPLLIEHLSDTRLTRTGKFHGANLGTWVEVERVGSICDHILQELSAGQYSPQEKASLEDRVKLAKRWFERAKSQGEESWFANNAITDDWPNEIPLRVLAAKYPKRFLALYREQYKKATNVVGIFLQAFVHAQLPDSVKLGFLVDAALHRDNAVAWPSLEVLKKLDQASFVACLTRYFERPFRGEPVEYRDYYFEEELLLLLPTKDANCWDAVTRNMQRWLPVHRASFVSILLSQDEQRSLFREPMRVRVVELLWDDPSVRVRRDMKDAGFPHAAYEYDQIAVRDAVTLAVADYLDIDIPWKPDRSSAEWDALRKKVQAAFAEAKRTR